MTTRYVEGFRVPKSIGPGRVLCHNHVQHTVDMPCGVNGFRAWTCEATDKPKNFIKCPCGYAGLPHYAWREHVKNVRTNPAWLKGQKGTRAGVFDAGGRRVSLTSRTPPAALWQAMED